MRIYKEVLRGGFQGPDLQWKTVSSDIYKLVKRNLISQVDFFSGVLSTFNWQDDTSKWQDMYRDIEIQSDHSDETKREHVAYQFKLAKILKHQPFNKFDDKAAELAIFDYSSSMLMMDVCKSFLVLGKAMVRILGSTEETIEAVLLQACVGSKRMNDLLNALRQSEVGEHLYEEVGFVRDTLASMRKASTITPEQLARGIVVDNIAGAYWGAQLCDWDLSNHQYLAWTGLQVDEEMDVSALDRIRSLCNAISRADAAAPARDDFIGLYLVPAVRSTVVISALLQLAAKMVDVSKCHAKSSVTIPAGAIMRPYDLFDADDARDEDVAQPTSLVAAHKEIQAEHAVLKRYVDGFKRNEFNKYAGISWPVRGEAGVNFNRFKKMGSIPARIPSVAESASVIANTTQLIATLMQAAAAPE